MESNKTIALQQLFKKRIQNPFVYRFFLFVKLPMAFFAGLRVYKLEEDTCSIQVRYSWITQNPFRSIYFAVLSMAAEMSTGLPVMMYTQHESTKFSMLVTGNEARFTKKAVGKIRFECSDISQIKQYVEKTLKDKEGVEFTLRTRGIDEQGIEVAQFTFYWSIKAK